MQSSSNDCPNSSRVCNRCSEQCDVISASSTVAVAQAKLRLEADRPFLRVQVGHTAELECCYRNSNNPVKWSWIKHAANGSLSEAPESTPVASSRSCGTLTLELVQLKDSGFYRCWLKSNNYTVMSHGTYLQVYSESSPVG